VQLVGLGRSEREEKEHERCKYGGYMDHGKLLSRVMRSPYRGFVWKDYGQWENR